MEGSNEIRFVQNAQIQCSVQKATEVQKGCINFVVTQGKRF